MQFNRTRLSQPSAVLRRALLAAMITLGLLAGGLGGGDAMPVTQAQGGTSLRFFGNGAPDIDRVKIPLGPLSNGQITSSYPVNVANSFTIEFWMKASAADNTAPGCAGQGWYFGNIIIDRDVDSNGVSDPSNDYGDYGIAICNSRLVFGVNAGGDDRLLVSNTVVADGAWHHVAAVRDGSAMRLYVDGQPAGSLAGPSGRIDYRTNRPTNQPNSDPYLVFGAEKHDYPGSRYYNGFLDDVRISNFARYNAAFTRPSGPHPADNGTVALYRFDEGSGNTIGDSSGAAGGPSNGQRRVGGNPAGPAWSSDIPFGSAPPPSPSASPSASPSTSPTPRPPCNRASTSVATGPSVSSGPALRPAVAATTTSRPGGTIVPVSADRAMGVSNALTIQLFLPLVACLR